MEKFDEPKPDLKVNETTTLKSDAPQPAVSRLVTEPAQLALTRADRTAGSPPKAEETVTWDAISDWFSLGQPLLWLVLLISIPWILSPTIVQGNTAGYLERARAYVETDRNESAKNNEEAIRWMKHAVSILPPLVNGKPEDAPTASRYSYMYTRLGGLYSNLNDFSTARSYYAKSVEMLPYVGDHSWDTWRRLRYGWTLRRDGRSDLAIKELEQVTTAANLAAEDWSFAWRELAISYNNVGRYNDALAAAKRSTEKSTGSELFWDQARRDTISGDAYEGLNRHKEAKEKYKTSAMSGIDHSARFAGDYLRGGGIFYEGSADHGLTANKWLEEALVKLKEAESGIFDESTVLNDLANNSMLMNNPQRAAGYLEQAKLFDMKKSDKETNLDYARDLYNLAKVKLALHDISGAKADLKHCLEIRKRLLGENNFLTKQAAAASS